MSESFQLWDWLSLSWFTPGTLLDFIWEDPWAFYAEILVVLIFIWKHRGLRASHSHIEISSSMQLPKRSSIHYLRFLPDILLMCSLTMLVIALARPQRINIQVEQTSEGIDIVLVVDVSESMRIEDFEPNRLEASKEIAIDFIRGRQYDRIGLVVFSGKAYSMVPLTTDYGMLKKNVQEITPFMIPETGTAIGNALGVATNRLRESTAKSKVIILLSDGDNTAGSLDPVTATNLAAYYKIKLYTILVGKSGKVPVPSKIFGKKKYVENTVDEATLREIAKIGEGEFFRASNNQSLIEVFQKINAYEKTEITETRFQSTQDFYPIYLTWAIVFCLLWLLSKSSFIANVLVD